MSKFDAARCQNLRLKCTKFDFRWVAPIAAFKGTYFWASEGEGKEGTEREGKRYRGSTQTSLEDYASQEDSGEGDIGRPLILSVWIF